MRIINNNLKKIWWLKLRENNKIKLRVDMKLRLKQNLISRHKLRYFIFFLKEKSKRNKLWKIWMQLNKRAII